MARSHSDDLIARGRKAGLSTRDLYAALSSRQPETTDDEPGRSDGNGYVAAIDEQGKRVFRPVSDNER